MFVKPINDRDTPFWLSTMNRSTMPTLIEKVSQSTGLFAAFAVLDPFSSLLAFDSSEVA
jgi:hypothetical protein